jgi:hypothetical protein
MEFNSILIISFKDPLENNNPIHLRYTIMNSKWIRVKNFLETRSCCIAQASLELTV